MLGTVDNGKVIFYNAPLNRVRIPATKIELRLDLVRLVAGDQRKFITHAAETKAAGVNIEALGRGNMPAPVLDAVCAASKSGLFVVVVSRTQEGRVEISDALIKSGVIA